MGSQSQSQKIKTGSNPPKKPRKPQKPKNRPNKPK